MDELKPPVVIGRCESCGYTLYDIDPFNSDCEACCSRIVNERDALRAENDRLREVAQHLAGCESESLVGGHVVVATSEIDALRARAEAAEKELEWRPIETAPKDGKAVLLHNNKAPGNPSGRMESCEGYNTVVGEWWASDQSDNDADGFGDWTCYMDAIEDPRCPFEPTHWMPLPAAPDQKGES